MKKIFNAKRILSVILALIILGSISTIAVNAATYNYNPSVAISYANAHWNDGVGKCAEFVSRCLKAGGISIPNYSYYSSGTKSYANNSGTLGDYTNPYLGSAPLLLYLSEHYKIITNPSNSDIDIGDVVFMYSKTNNGQLRWRDGHVGICVKKVNGAPKYAAHNRAQSAGGFSSSYPCTYVAKINSSSTHAIDSNYSKNFTAYPKVKITASNIFDANHCSVSSSAWIGTSDKCIIHEVYTDGCCKVTYPLDNGGTRTVYSKISLFNTAKNYYLDLNSYLNGSYRGDIYGIATADVYINGKRVANDVTDYYTAHPAGTTYKITDIRVKSGYKYNGRSSYSGTLNGNVNINLSFSTAVTYFTTNFSMKSGAYTNAYSSSSCSSKVGRIYPGDVITLKRIYSNGIAQVVCPWNDGIGSYNKTVYCKISELKFKATHYIQAYSSINGSTCGRVYPNDLVTVCAVYSSGWMKAVCPWTNGVNKTIYIKCNSIY